MAKEKLIEAAARSDVHIARLHLGQKVDAGRKREADLPQRRSLRTSSNFRAIDGEGHKRGRRGASDLRRKVEISERIQSR